VPNLRVKARHAPVKNIFGEYLEPLPRSPLGPRAKSRLPLVHEGASFETGYDRNGVFGEAEVEVLFVAETL